MDSLRAVMVWDRGVSCPCWLCRRTTSTSAPGCSSALDCGWPIPTSTGYVVPDFAAYDRWLEEDETKHWPPR